MKTQKKNEVQAKRAFTLIEMIGVLAVIAILAALLIPKIFEAINNSRINNAAVSYNTIKTAVADHYAKYGALNSQGGTPFTTLTGSPATNYDVGVLLQEQFIDKPFKVKIGTGSEVQLVAGSTADATAAASDSAFWLSGEASNTNEIKNATYVLVAVIHGVTANDAKDLNDRLDGEQLGSAVGVEDLKGRVKIPTLTAGAAGDMYIYVTHR